MTQVTEPAKINDNNHGPRVVLAGTIMLCATALMVAISGYNRYQARTLSHVDTPLLVAGAVLNVVFFALSIVMVNHGLGRHRSTLSVEEVEFLRKLFLGNLLVFFVAHCAVKIAYNLLARRTARSQAYNKRMDAFSAIIIAWTVSNIIVVAYYLGSGNEPSLYFILISGSISIVIVMGQLFAFLFIIWNTTVKLRQKLSWSLCMTMFVPFTVAVIIVRLVFTPSVLFTDDWTFDNTNVMVLFLLDLNMVIMTVLAPNLPMFFAKTSTGGLNFMPTATGSRSDSVYSHKMTKGSGSRSTHTHKTYDRSTLETTIESTVEQERGRSFGSDVILLRRSVEVVNGASDPNILHLPQVITRGSSRS